ncbi:rho GTPase-activating protein 5-like [Magnolia sinica]|uniref:rho GTPase-activating protein 5-like n=1 Tax=Magnolia sinica TaxID=86752 RepID=UPI00265AD54E|nr:rho GTPase-activating protein 5-like [Magnolia sinica]
MTEVLQSPSHFPSSPSSLSCAPHDSLSCAPNDATSPHITPSLLNQGPPPSLPVEESDTDKEEEEDRKKKEEQLSLLALLVAIFRKSLVACRTAGGRQDLRSMEIGWPTDVRHVAHVTFDRFNGFLGLPVEFEPEVPRRAPSASANVFGVSTESMQCSYDSRGNSVPTILLLMQRRLYSQGGLQAEGIFRINAENSQEEYVRDQLNRGIVPDGIDVHCLAGLIKAWFRELPNGVLDSLAPEQVMQCQSEEECAQLMRLLPPTEAALMDWAVNLMADVVQEEHQNKMNARNVAMVFAPNMTQMADPLTALMYAVQVMNFLKMLIIKTLKEREDPVLAAASASHSDPSDENGRHSPSQPCLEVPGNEDGEADRAFVTEEPVLDSHAPSAEENSTTDDADDGILTSSEKAVLDGNGVSNDDASTPTNRAETAVNASKTGVQVNTRRSKAGQSSNLNLRKSPRRVGGLPSLVRAPSPPAEKSKGASIVSRINSRVERVEAWR